VEIGFFYFQNFKFQGFQIPIAHLKFEFLEFLEFEIFGILYLGTVFKIAKNTKVIFIGKDTEGSNSSSIIQSRGSRCRSV
jgi:hypothetical protein